MQNIKYIITSNGTDVWYAELDYLIKENPIIPVDTILITHDDKTNEVLMYEGSGQDFAHTGYNVNYSDYINQFNQIHEMYPSKDRTGDQELLHQQHHYYFLIAGSRSIDASKYYAAAKQIILNCMKNKLDVDADMIYSKPQNIHIVHGNADGVDMIADKLASSQNFNLHRFPANFSTYQSDAGFFRNELMHMFLKHMQRVTDYDIDVYVICLKDAESNGLGTVHNIMLGNQYANHGIYLEVKKVVKIFDPRVSHSIVVNYELEIISETRF